MEYKIEDLRFYNMNISNKYVANATRKDGRYKIFDIEKQLNEDEKVKFIDELKDGIASYLLNIFSKWGNEKITLPKDNYGHVKTVSKKAWIKRNDERSILDNNYKIGSYHLFDTKFKSMNVICPTTEYSSYMAYTGENIVNQWFHDLCNLLYREEQQYFKKHDSFQIKLSELRDLGNRHSTVFNSQELNDIIHNRKDDITEERINEYIDAYDKLEQLISQISIELNPIISEE